MSFSIMFFRSLLVNGSERQFFYFILVVRAAVDIHMLPPALVFPSGSAPTKLKQNRPTVNRVGRKDHHHDAHVSQDVWRKQGTRAVCQLTALHAVLKNRNIFVLEHVVVINATQVVWDVSNVVSIKSGLPVYLLGWCSPDVKMGKMMCFLGDHPYIPCYSTGTLVLFYFVSCFEKNHLKREPRNCHDFHETWLPESIDTRKHREDGY